MTNSLSPSDPRGQQPDPAGQCDLPGILPFDLHAEGQPDEVGGTGGPDTLPLPGGPRGDDDADADGDAFDHDGDTDLADAGARGGEFDGYDDDDDDPPPANAGAVGLPCTRGGMGAFDRNRPLYSLCAVEIVPDPGFPSETDDPDYLAAGQELCRLNTRSMAVAACDGYSLRPEMIARNFRLAVPRCTHLVVNDRAGKELHRRPILAAA